MYSMDKKKTTTKSRSPKVKGKMVSETSPTPAPVDAKPRRKKKDMDEQMASPQTKPDSSSEVQSEGGLKAPMQEELLSVGSSPEKNSSSLLPPAPNHPFSYDLNGPVSSDPGPPPGYIPLSPPQPVTSSPTIPAKSLALLATLSPFNQLGLSLPSLETVVGNVLNLIQSCPPWALLVFHEDKLIIESKSIGAAGLWSILLWNKDRQEWDKIVQRAGGDKIIPGQGPFESRVSVLTVIERMLRDNKTKQIDKTITEILGWGEGLTMWFKGAQDNFTLLKKELEEYILERTNNFKHNSKQLPELKTVSDIAQIALETKEVHKLAEAVSDLIANSPEVLIRVLNKLTSSAITTSPSPSGNRQLEIYHPLYPTKRLNQVSLDSMEGDLWAKVLMAERMDLIRLTYYYPGGHNLSLILPPLVLSLLPQPLNTLLPPLLLKSGISFLPGPLIPLLNHTIPLEQLYRSVYSVLSHYHSQLCSLVPIPTSPERIHADIADLMTTNSGLNKNSGINIEDNGINHSSFSIFNNPGVSIGLKPSAKLGLKSVVWVRTRGAALDDKGEVNGGECEENGVVDVEFEIGMKSVIEKTWPSHITVEANSAHGVRVAKCVKEIVGKMVFESKNRLKMPIFVLKKVEISELRAFSLSEQKKHSLDFVYLIAYSMACYALDPLAECIKLRFISKEVPGLKNDLAVVSLC